MFLYSAAFISTQDSVCGILDDGRGYLANQASMIDVYLPKLKPGLLEVEDGVVDFLIDEEVRVALNVFEDALHSENHLVINNAGDCSVAVCLYGAISD